MAKEKDPIKALSNVVTRELNATIRAFHLLTVLTNEDVVWASVAQSVERGTSKKQAMSSHYEDIEWLLALSQERLQAAAIEVAVAKQLVIGE